MSYGLADAIALHQNASLNREFIFWRCLMSKKNKILNVYCQSMNDLITSQVSQRLAIAQAAGLSPYHFEPKSLPSVPFEFDAIIDGVRYEKLKGELKFGGMSRHGTFKIDFPDNVDEQKWRDACQNKLQEMVQKKLDQRGRSNPPARKG